MLNPTFTDIFKKDRKRAQKRGWDMNELVVVMSMLINEQPLLPRHKNHPLRGKYRGKWECHVQSDWLLIYCVDRVNGKIIFYNTGTHSDLF